MTTTETLNMNSPLVAKKYLCLRPILGYSTWTYMRTAVTEAKLISVANLLKQNGLYEAGYNFINIDSGWKSSARDENGIMEADPVAFPDGLAGTIQRLHAMGFKVGIYSSPGYTDCVSKQEGSKGYEAIDAKFWSDCGVDYLKYDRCSMREEEDYDERARFALMGQLISEQEHDIIYHIANSGATNVATWGGRSAHIIRICGDNRLAWSSENDGLGPQAHTYMANYENGLLLQRYNRKNAILDMDMSCFSSNGTMYGNSTTEDEKRSYFSILCMLQASIVESGDLSQITATMLAMMKNKKALSINQDPGFTPCRRIYSESDHDILVKEIEGGFAVMFLNRSESDWQVNTMDYTFVLPNYTLNGNVFDVWDEAQYGTFGSGIVSTIPTHACKLYIVKNG